MRIKKELRTLLDNNDLYITNNVIGYINQEKAMKYNVYTCENMIYKFSGNTQNEVIEIIKMRYSQKTNQNSW